eukprot:SAG31_NODE_40382_length_281_cov_0.697802_1_plen_93_part_11
MCLHMCTLQDDRCPATSRNAELERKEAEVRVMVEAARAREESSKSSAAEIFVREEALTRRNAELTAREQQAEQARCRCAELVSLLVLPWSSVS